MVFDHVLFNFKILFRSPIYTYFLSFTCLALPCISPHLQTIYYNTTQSITVRRSSTIILTDRTNPIQPSSTLSIRRPFLSSTLSLQYCFQLTIRSVPASFCVQFSSSVYKKNEWRDCGEQNDVLAKDGLRMKTKNTEQNEEQYQYETRTTRM